MAWRARRGWTPRGDAASEAASKEIMIALRHPRVLREEMLARVTPYGLRFRVGGDACMAGHMLRAFLL